MIFDWGAGNSRAIWIPGVLNWDDGLASSASPLQPGLGLLRWRHRAAVFTYMVPR